MAVVRAQIADRTRRLIGEIEPAFGPISWRLNNVGKVTFALAKTDAKATEMFLQFGNYLLLDFDNGLPTWGGLIDLPRNWSEDSIQCTAYSGEYLLGLRQTDRGRYFSSVLVGYIYEQIIADANAVYPTGITMGTAWGGGDPHSPEYHFKNLLEICRESISLRLETADFYIQPAEEAGFVTFTAYLYERRGMDKPGVALIEGHNVAVARTSLREQGPIINSWDLAGEGTTWGDDRLISHAEDTESIETYGLREASRVYADVSVQITLDSNATNLLAETSQPRNILPIGAMNLEPASFEAYDVGDSIRVELQSYGFDGYDHMVRVLTREYYPDDDVCVLVVQEDD